MAADTIAINDSIQEERVSEENAQATTNLLANATLQDRHEVLQTVTEGVNVDTASDAGDIGRELDENSELITQKLSTENYESNARSIEQALLELVDAILDTIFPKPGSEEEEVTAPPNTQQLDQEFDNAIGRLIDVPWAKQKFSGKLVTFLKCTTFAIRLVKRYKQSRKDASDTSVAWVVRNVGRLLIRAAGRYGLYTYIIREGGWHQMYSTVHNFIANLRREPTATATDTGTPGNSLLPAYAIPTVAVVGAVVAVGVGYYVYIRYRN